MLNNFLNDINLNYKDKPFLILLLCYSLLLTIILMEFHLSRGAFNSDIYVYLGGALDLAGLNFNHISDPSWIQNSPLIIFLTSILFRLGLVDFKAIILVTAIFSILGIIGMYIFLKIRFSPLLSFTGAILFSSLSLTLFYFANGMLDIPAVTMIIFTLIFTVCAVNKNPKYYILVGILFSLSFFTRYTTTYIIAIIVLYILKNHDIINLVECLVYNKQLFFNRISSFFKSKECKWIVISSILSISIFVIVFELLLSSNIKLTYLNMASGSVSNVANQLDANYIPDKGFFIKNFLSLLSCKSITFDKLFVEKFNRPTILSYLIMLILFSGIILKLINFLKNIKYYKTYSKNVEFRNRRSKIILLILILILIVIGGNGFEFNYLYTLVSLWLIFLIILSLLNEYPINKDDFSLYISCLGLFLFYLIIVSFMDIKCVRYLLPAIPGFIYLVIYSLDCICKFIKSGFDNERSLKNKYDLNVVSNSKFRYNFSRLIPIFLIVICLIFAFNFTNTVEFNQDGLDRIAICDFIKEYDPDYQSKEILCMWDLRYFEWYLNKDIKKVGEDFNESQLNINKYDYIITFEKPIKDKNFRDVYHAGYYHLNKKSN